MFLKCFNIQAQTFKVISKKKAFVQKKSDNPAPLADTHLAATGDSRVSAPQAARHLPYTALTPNRSAALPPSS